MAKLPTEADLGQRPALSPTLGLAQYRGEIPNLEAPGQAEMQAGAALDQIGKEIFQADKERQRQLKVEQEHADTIRAQEAINKLKERALDLQIGEAEGYLNLKGAAATNTDLVGNYKKKYDEAYSQISDSLSTPGQKEKFALHSSPVKMSFTEGLFRHQVKESDVQAKETLDGTTSVGIRTASANWDKPLLVDLEVRGIENAVKSMAERNNWPAVYAEAQRLERVSKVYTAVVDQAVATGNLVYAGKVYEEHRADIEPNTAKRLEIAVRDGEQKQLSNGYRAEFLAVQGNYKALGALKAKVMADPTLNEDRINALVGPIQNQQMMIERRAEAAQARWERNTERTINSFNANTLAGYPGTDPKIGLELVNSVKGTPLEAMARDAFHLANATRDFSSKPPVEQQQLLAQAEAAVRRDPSKVDRRVVDAWKTIAANQEKEVKENPTGFAARQGLVELLPVDLGKPDASAPALAQRYDVAKAVSAQYSVPVKPLQPEEVRKVSAALSQGSPEAQAAYLGKLKNGWAGNTQGYMATMAQLAPDNPVAAVAGSHAGLDRWDAASLILRGQSYLHPNKKEDGSPVRTDLVSMPPMPVFEQKFKDTVGDAFAGKADQRSAALQAVRAAYAAQAVDSPKDADTKSVNNTFFEKAMKVVVGEVASQSGGRSVILPYGYDTSMFKDGKKRLVDQLYDQGIKTDFTKDRLIDLPLVNRGDGRYVFMAGDSIVLDKAGQPITLDFNRGLPFIPSGRARDAVSATKPADITDLSRRTTTQK